MGAFLQTARDCNKDGSHEDSREHWEPVRKESQPQREFTGEREAEEPKEDRLHRRRLSNTEI